MTEEQKMAQEMGLEEALAEGRATQDGKLFFTKDSSILFCNYMNTHISLGRKDLKWVDIKGKLIVLTIEEAKTYASEIIFTLSSVLLPKE